MFGLDDWVAHFSDGTTVAFVAVVAVVLGLRHATDPDHVTAVATLIAGEKERARRAAMRLGLAWGLGHAASLFAFGLPIVVFKAYLPDPVQRAAETSVGVMIALLALWLLIRWRRGFFHLHHDHGGPHAHGRRGAIRTRSPVQAFAVGLLHGMGGSAGVGVLLLASIHGRPLAVGALAVFALCTALSMAALSTGWGIALAAAPVRSSFTRVAPVLGCASLAFGVWYALAAVSLAPYYF
jgi:ABC-type nickel/cobalt efflux system permease component RcnA